MTATAKIPPGFHVVPCDGAAHENPHIDHCARCAPAWGELLIPAEYPTAEAWRDAYAALRGEPKLAIQRRVKRARGWWAHHRRLALLARGDCGGPIGPPHSARGLGQPHPAARSASTR